MVALASICGTLGIGPVAIMIATGALMTVAMMAPCAMVEARRVRDRRVAFALGYAAVMLAVGAGGAALELMLAEARVLDAPMVRPALGLAAAVLLVVQFTHRARLFAGGFRSGASHARHQLPLCLAMIAAQLALGPMDLMLMVALGLWMLAYALRSAQTEAKHPLTKLRYGLSP